MTKQHDKCWICLFLIEEGGGRRGGEEERLLRFWIMNVVFVFLSWNILLAVTENFVKSWNIEGHHEGENREDDGEGGSVDGPLRAGPTPAIFRRMTSQDLSNPSRLLDCPTRCRVATLPAPRWFLSWHKGAYKGAYDRTFPSVWNKEPARNKQNTPNGGILRSKASRRGLWVRRVLYGIRSEALDQWESSIVGPWPMRVEHTVRLYLVLTLLVMAENRSKVRARTDCMDPMTDINLSG